jgi:5-methylcytosine-specific restriction protein A
MIKYKRNLTVEDFPISGVGENGRNLCRVCKTEVPKGRRTICSGKCQIDISIQTSSSFARHYVGLRDKGVCALCNLDTKKLKRVLKKLCYRQYKKKKPKAILPNSDKTVVNQVIKFYKSVWISQLLDKYTWFDYNKHTWEADHIIPVCMGGTLVLTNLRTLCIKCHKDETKRLMREYLSLIHI